MTTSHVWKKMLNPSVFRKWVECSHLLILLNSQSLSRGRLRAADTLTTLVLFFLLGGLAAEELGKPIAWGSSRRDPDTEETPSEHAHFNPRSAQEHEMETAGSASTQALFTFILHRRCVMFMFVCLCQDCTCVYIWILERIPSDCKQTDTPHEAVNRKAECGCKGQINYKQWLAL